MFKTMRDIKRKFAANEVFKIKLRNNWIYYYKEQKTNVA